MAQFGAPNFLKVIDAYEAGADRAERSRLRDLSEQGRALTGKALAGDQNALAQLGGVDLPAYMQVKQLGEAEKKQFLTDFTRAAYAAKTPEQRAALLKSYEAKGHVFDAWEKDPNNWDALVSRGVDLGDQMGLDLRREEAARNQKNSDRAYNLDVQQFNDIRRVHDAQIAASNNPKAPSGYRYKQDGSLESIAGGPADPKVKASQGAGGITTKMHNDAVSVNQAYNNLDAGLKDYDALIKKTGVSVVPGSESDQIQQARTNLQLQLKELYNLGVLNGPDLGLMQQMIFDPQVHALDPIGSGAKLLGAAGYGETVAARASKSIKNLRDTLKSIRDNKTKGILDENGNFVGGSAPPASQQQGGLEPGVTEDGYRFLGGDPADQNNWEPVQ